MADTRKVYTQWLRSSDNVYYPTDNSETVDRFEPGIYSLHHSDSGGFYFIKKSVHLDELLHLPMKEYDDVLNGIETFWERKQIFKDYGYTFKRGILLYGIPGGGKTSLINLIIDKIIKERDGVVFTINSEDDLSLYQKMIPDIFRMIEPETPILTIIEDIDGLCQYSEVETRLLNVLDGIDQSENIIHLATTNYTEKLPERILARPNRFDVRVEVKSPNAECRKMYFENKLKPKDLKNIDLDNWVKSSEGLSMAALGELIKSVIVLGNDFDYTLSSLLNMKNFVSSRNYDEEFKTKIGFRKNE